MLSLPTGSTLRRLSATLLISAAGGFAANLAGLPAGWLSGGMLAVVVASLSGVHTLVPRFVSTPAYFLLGLYAGSGVSPETLVQIRTWPASFLILALSLVAVVYSCYLLLNRRYGWDPQSALLSSLPGALSFVVAAAERVDADMKKVAVAQSLRVFMLVELIPLATYVIGQESEAGPGTRVETLDTAELALLVAVAFAAGFVLERLRMPGGWLLGGLLASAALLLGGIVDGHLPAFLLAPCTIVIAAITGSRFRPGDWAILPRLAGPALAAFALALAISVVAAGIVTLAFGISFLQTLFAFAPGAQEAVIVLAFAMGFDPAYVAAHHVVRFLGMILAVPVLMRMSRRPD